MTVGAFTLFNVGKENIINGSYDLDGDTIKAMLLTSDYTPSVSDDEDLADIVANECSNGDYARQTVALTIDESSGSVTVGSDDISFGSAVTITAKYLVLYDDTDGSDGLIGYVDLDTEGGSVSSVGGLFRVNTPNEIFVVA